MNFKNYKLEVLTLIDEYKNEKNKENKKISEDDIFSNSVNEVESEIKLLDDNNCLSTRRRALTRCILSQTVLNFRRLI